MLNLSVKSGLSRIVVLLALMLLVGVASPHFFATDNLLNVVEQSSINALLGMGVTFVIIAGGIDLSVGSILALSGLVGAHVMVHGGGVAAGMLSALLLGAACGIFNGLVITLTRIPPFIATLGMMLVARSAARIFSDQKPISGLPHAFTQLAGNFLGIPILAWLVLLTYALGHAILTRTQLGRYAYAIGGNEQASWLSGVAVTRYKCWLYGVSGLLAGLAGALLSARLNAASPLAGDMYELYAIAAAVIGGVSLLGGEGSVFGTLIGALIMGVLRNGLNLLNVPSAWEGIVVGGVLVAAVAVDRGRHVDFGQLRLPKWLRPVLIGGLFAVLLGAACYVRMSSQSATITIAFVPKAVGSPFWTAMQEGAQREADRRHVRLVALAADRETDVERQYQIVENLIEQHVQAILLAPSGSKELVGAIRKANDAHIPVFLIDSNIDAEAAAAVDAHVMSYIGSDNFAGGVLAGEALAQALEQRGEVAIIEGPVGHATAEARRLGCLQALQKFGQISVVASQTANSERERGFGVVQNILQAHPALRGVFAANDEMALGALQAIDAAGKSREVLVVGFDAVPEALAMIHKGRMLGSVAQFPDEMGRLGVAAAVDFLQSGIVPAAVVHTKVEIKTAANSR